MGNKLCKRRQVVDDKYTKPQGLYEIKDVDYKKLRKLILESKLAPCYPGGDECDCGLLEECPICFLYYPSLNRSRCCMKSICTECFLQMKNPNSTRPTQCPFCKTSNYAVEYRGVKSKEEKGIEQIEEQKVIEAKIRMQKQELQEEEERLHKKEEISSSSRATQTGEPACGISGGVECEEVSQPQDPSVTQTLGQSQIARQNRNDEFDVDLEDIMVMEAIWLSIQENGRAVQSPMGGDVPEQFPIGDCHASSETGHETSSASSPSGGLACAIAALAERQQLTGESSSNNNGQMSHLNMLPSSSRSSKRVKKNARNPAMCFSSAKEMSHTGMPPEECGLDHASGITEVGTSYSSSSFLEHEALMMPPPSPSQFFRRNSKRVKNARKKYSPFERTSSKDSSRNEKMVAKEWDFYHSSVVAEAGTTYNSSDDSDEGVGTMMPLPPPPPPPPPPFLSSPDEGGTFAGCSEDEEGGGEYHATMPPPPYNDDGFQSAIPAPVVPESFEEQMMLAMAVSLAEARARMNAQGVAWQ